MTEADRLRVRVWTNTHKAEMIQMLSDFVRVPSVKDMESATIGAPFGEACGRMLDVIEQQAEKMGLLCETHEGYCLDIRAEEKSDGEIGIFAHSDVVTPTGEWIFPPFCGTIDGDFVLGRGAHDNKCACVMGLFLLKMLKELDLAPKHPVRLFVGADEESGMSDIAYYRAHVPLPAVSLVPDCVYPVNFAQKGGFRGEISLPLTEPIISMKAGIDFNVPAEAECLLRLPLDVVENAVMGMEDVTCEESEGGVRVYARGIATHSANPWIGRSALLALVKALLKLCPENQTLSTLYDLCSDYKGVPLKIDAEDRHTGYNTIVLGSVRTEKSRIICKVIAKCCQAMTPETLRQRFLDWCEASGVQTEQLIHTKSTYIDPNDLRVQVLQRSWREMTGRTDEPYCTGGGTYSRELPDAITYGIIGFFGDRPKYIPKETGSAHEANEYIDIAVVQKGIECYADAVLALDELLSKEQCI